MADDTVRSRIAVEGGSEEMPPRRVGIAAMQIPVAQHQLQLLAQSRVVGSGDELHCREEISLHQYLEQTALVMRHGFIRVNLEPMVLQESVSHCITRI